KIHNLHAVNLIPMIWSWDGVLSPRHHQLAKQIGISKEIRGYIQSRILKQKFNSFLSRFQKILPDFTATDVLTEICTQPYPKDFTEDKRNDEDVVVEDE
ncbi:MAG: hypothetical protein MHPSP_004686, partial [Paramarteilia canceri]